MMILLVHLFQTVKKEYSYREAELGPEQSVNFKDTCISLDIPRKGVFQDQWKVFPSIPPKVAILQIIHDIMQL